MGHPAVGFPGWASVLPGLARLRRYERSWLRGDLVAGCTVAAYLIPQVMACAEVAGLPPVTGLWAISGSLAVYAVFGSSRQLSVGPESTTALMTAATVAPLAAGDPGRYAALAATLALMVGAVCLAAWTLRLGFLAELLSRPVLIGYLSGVAVIMIVGQFAKVTAIRVHGGTTLSLVGSVLAQLPSLNWPTLALAVSVLAVLVAGTRWFPRAPVPLIVILLAAGAVAVLHLRGHGVMVVGVVPGGVPLPAIPGLVPRP